MKLVSVLCAIFFIQQQTAESAPALSKSVRFTTNVTLVEAGRPFEAACLLENFASTELSPNTRLRVYLYIKLTNLFTIKLFDVIGM